MYYCTNTYTSSSTTDVVGGGLEKRKIFYKYCRVRKNIVWLGLPFRRRSLSMESSLAASTSTFTIASVMVVVITLITVTEVFVSIVIVGRLSRGLRGRSFGTRYPSLIYNI